MITRVSTILLAALIALPGHAQRGLCGDGAQLIAHLEKDWGEVPEVVALDAAGRLVRHLVNPQTGTWSMLVTTAGGRTCLVATGTAWEPATPPRKPGDPS